MENTDNWRKALEIIKRGLTLTIITIRTSQSIQTFTIKLREMIGVKQTNR